ncbi:MAG TPA: C4-type zinc ribbon domain-containing protein [Jiangellaceae bacterium]|nr:C4-type zinc ribbon domain-containing protein [Jiangellaceae bacterium]
MDHARPYRRGESPLNADPAAQLRLLDLQAHDLKLDQLAHRRRTLPEIAELETLAAEHSRLKDAEVATTTEVTDLEREQKRADADVEQVRRRKERDQQRLDAGQVSAARELERLQSEIGSLNRRQADLEDAELEIMEKLEDAQQRLAALAAERERVGRHALGVQQARDAARAEIDADVERIQQERAAVAAEIPADLLTLYEKVRATSDGIGAAALRKRRCEGCHLELDPMSLAGIRSTAADEVIRCEECRRILVRTPESGL